MSSKYANHSRTDSQHNRGFHLYDHLMNTKIFTLIIKHSTKTHEAIDYGHDMDSQTISHYSRVPYPYKKRAQREKVVHLIYSSTYLTSSSDVII